MGTNECSQPASKSSWDSQDFGDVNMVLKMLHFHKSSRPQWVKGLSALITQARAWCRNLNIRGELQQYVPWLLMPWLIASPGHQQP